MPQNYIERLFLHQLVRSRIQEPIIRFNRVGHPYFAWCSPCPEIGALNAYIPNGREIMLSYNITHSYYTGGRPESRWITNRHAKARAVKDAIADIELFLNNQIVVSKCVDGSGKTRTMGWFRGRLTEKEIEQSAKKMSDIFRTDIREITYVFSGEYAPLIGA